MDTKCKSSEILQTLTTAERIKLTSGRDFWSTEPIPRKVRSLRVSDGPLGLRYQANGDSGITTKQASTSFPAASAVACSWDPKLLAQMGQAIAKEAASLKVAMVLGPAINIKRNPLGGRNFEYYSEDPYLAGKLATAWIQGCQSQGIGACLKHFACNDQENQRLLSDSILDAKALNEIYLEAFRIAVTQAQPEAIMCAYNKVNGTYMSENQYLLTDVLRKTWNFKGLVMTDWGALDDKAYSLNAGTDLEMPGSRHIYDAEAQNALKTGKLKLSALNRAAGKVLALANKPRPSFHGLRVDLLEKNALLAQKLEEQAAVLLQNQASILPLKPSDKLLVIGTMADKTRYQGGGSAHINAYRTTSILQGLSQANITYNYVPGYTLDGQPNRKLQLEAATAAKTADKVVIVAGLPETAESEGFDRKTMDLPANQNALIEAVASVNPNVIVLLCVGAPVELPWLNQVKGLLNLYLGGESVGKAAQRLLYGAVNPSGKLAESFPIHYQDVPSSRLFDKNSRHVGYAESIYVGYRYYDKAHFQVNFPFGFGLSYAKFTLSHFQIDHATLKKGDNIQVSLDVTNTSPRDGSEVVQIYVQNPATGFHPEKELKAFQKVFVKAGVTQSVTLTLPSQAFTVWSLTDKTWVFPTGTCNLLVGTSSRQIKASLTTHLIGERVNEPTYLPKWYTQPMGKPTLTDFTQMSGLTVPKDYTPQPGTYTRNSPLRDLQRNSFVLKQFTRLVYRTHLRGLKPGSPEALFAASMVYDTPLVRLAAMSQGQISLGLVDQLVKIANKQFK